MNITLTALTEIPNFFWVASTTSDIPLQFLNPLGMVFRTIDPSTAGSGILANVLFPPLAVGAWLELVAAYLALCAWYAIDRLLARTHIELDQWG